MFLAVKTTDKGGIGFVLSMGFEAVRRRLRVENTRNRMDIFQVRKFIYRLVYFKT